jgi:Flp pilus assembly protein TadD
MKWLARMFARERPAPALNASADAERRADAAALAARIERALEGDGPATALIQAERAIEQYPDDAGLNELCGRAHLAAGDAEGALDFFELAQHYAPESETALAGRVHALERLGRAAELPQVFRGCLAAAPTHRGALFGLALDAERNGRFGEAIELLERALAASPDDAGVLNLLGLLRARELADFVGGEALLRRALALSPSDSNAAANLGWVLAESGRQEEGLAVLDRLVDAQSEDPEMRLMRALVELKRGNFSAGWRDYGARFASRASVPRPFQYPDWGASSPARKRVLVFGEQGLGDQIMFASCLPDLFREAASSVIDCDPRLAPLFARSFPSASVHGTRQDDPAPPWLDALGAVDMQIPIGDLPRRYRQRLSDFPRHGGYLRPDPVKVGRYAQRLDALGPGVAIGLSWRGGTQSSRAALRSVGLAGMAPLIARIADERPAKWVSLQYTPCSEELAAFRDRTGVTIHHWQEAIDDYDDTAALVTALDVVVTVCTAVVHLAGALGRPAVVMVPIAAEWRYGASVETMPWYPSVRLLRQSVAGDWRGVLDAIPGAVRRLL